MLCLCASVGQWFECRPPDRASSGISSNDTCSGIIQTSWAVREVASTGSATMIHDCLNLENGKIRVLKVAATVAIAGICRVSNSV